MATKQNPFSAGLSAWAEAMDPYELARGQSLQGSIRKSGLEEQILNDRIRHRGLLASNPEGDPFAVAAALSNDSFSPQAAVQANLNARAAKSLLDPTATPTPEWQARVMAARGDTANQTIGDMLAGRKAQRDLQTITDKAGNVYGVLPDDKSPTGYSQHLMFPAPVEKPKTIVIPSAGGTAYSEDPVTGKLTPAITQGPVKAFDAIAAKRARDQADRMLMGSGYQGVEAQVNYLLGATDMMGNRIGNRPTLNPFEMASVVADVDRITKAGYTLNSAIQAALRRHRLSQSNISTGEFEGDQSWGWIFNPAMQSEVDADKQGLPSTPEGGEFMRGSDTRFFSSTDPTDYTKNVQKTDFVRDDEVIVPLDVVAKATDLGDDFGAATAEPRFAKPAVTASGAPQVAQEGVIYYSKRPNGGVSYGVGRRDKDGNMVVVPIE